MSLEGGNTYPDAILRQQDRENREEQRYLDSSFVEAGERAAISGETEEGIAELGESMERERQVQEALARFEQLSERESLEGFDVFKVFLEQASREVQENFLSRIGSRNIRNSSLASGRFPVNEFEFQQSLVEGTILENISNTENEVAETENEVAETENEVAETENEVAETEIMIGNEKLSTQEAKDRIINFHESTEGIRNPDPRLDTLIGELIDTSVSDTVEIKNIFEQITRHLSQINYIETNILPQAQASGNYEAVRRSIIELGGGNGESGGIFEARILAWENTPLDFGEFPAEQMMRVSGALGVRVDEVGSDARQSGNIFSLGLPGGAMVEYDVMRDTRTLSVDGYRLSSQVPDVGDYQTPKLAYMRVEQAHLPQLQKIVAAGEAIGQAGVESDNLGQIQDILKNTLGISYFVELGLNTLESAKAIQTRLSEAYSEHHEPIKKARAEYRDTLTDLRNNYARALEKRDKKTREVLDFFRSIGLTQIPQSLTDQIFETLNRSPSRAALYGFNKLPIDFANGNLGIDLVAGESDGLEMPSKVAFAEFINAMLGSEIINIPHLRSGTGAPVGDMRQLQNIIANSGILNAGGIARAWENIETHYSSQI